MEQTSGNGQGMFDQYRPKTAKVLVGEVVLRLDEPPALVLEAIAKLLGTNEVATALALVGEIIAGTTQASAGTTFVETLMAKWPRIVSAVRDAVLPLMLRQLPTALAVVLDTPANRRTVREALAEQSGGAAIAEWPVVEDDDGLLVCAPMRRWVTAHVTTPQVEHAIGVVTAMRPWGDLGKRMLAALGLTIGAPRQTGSPT